MLPPRPSECRQALLYTKSNGAPLSGSRADLNVFRVTLQEPPPGEGFDADAFKSNAEKEGFVVHGFGTTQEIDKMEAELKIVLAVQEA